VNIRLLTKAVLLASLVLPSIAFSSELDKPVADSPEKPGSAPAPAETMEPSHRVGIGCTLSLLGVGGEAAVSMTRRFNVRAGFNLLGYSRAFNQDGVTYSGKLTLQSVQTLVDFFPFGGRFHLSPGAMIYNGNQVTAKLGVPGGQGLSIAGSDYISDPTNPIGGSGKLQVNRAAPMFLVGFGNLARAGHRHFAMSFDIGAAYQGTPHAILSLTGSACDPSGASCRSVSDPSIQSHVAVEQAKMDRSVSLFRFYPVISTGFGYRF